MRRRGGSGNAGAALFLIALAAAVIGVVFAQVSMTPVSPFNPEKAVLGLETQTGTIFVEGKGGNLSDIQSACWEIYPIVIADGDNVAKGVLVLTNYPNVSSFKPLGDETGVILSRTTTQELLRKYHINPSCDYTVGILLLSPKYTVVNAGTTSTPWYLWFRPYSTTPTLFYDDNSLKAILPEHTVDDIKSAVDDVADEGGGEGIGGDDGGVGDDGGIGDVGVGDAGAGGGE